MLYYSDILNELAERIRKPCCELLVDKGVPHIKDDKLGGRPYLPVGLPYPTTDNGEPLYLLLQINLSHIELDGFPNSGILEIFVDKDLSWPAVYKIFLFPEGEPYHIDYPYMETQRFVIPTPLKLRVNHRTTIMSSSDYRFEDIFREIVRKYGKESEIESIRDEYFRTFYNPQTLTNCCIGGYNDFTQTDPRKKEDNRDECLFKLDSNIGHSVHIGDSGIINVMISKEDLESGDLEKAILDWDCL